MEFLIIVGVWLIWFVLGVISVLSAYALGCVNFNLHKYRPVNKTGKKNSKLKIFSVVATLGPIMGVLFYYVTRSLVYTKQDTIVVEEESV